MDIPITTRCALLLALRANPTGYGRALVSYVRDATGGAINLSDGVVYTCIDSLVREKLARDEGVRIPTGGGRPARLLSLTPAGRKEADAQVEALRGLLGAVLLPQLRQQVLNEAIIALEAAYIAGDGNTEGAPDDTPQDVLLRLAAAGTAPAPRPTKEPARLTPAQVDGLCHALSRGLPLVTACAALGLDTGLVDAWTTWALSPGVSQSQADLAGRLVAARADYRARESARPKAGGER